MIREFKRSLASSPIKRSASSSMLLIAIHCSVMPSFQSKLNSTSNMSCARGIAENTSNNQPFRLCSGNESGILLNFSKPLKHVLPISPTNDKIEVQTYNLLPNSTYEGTKACDRLEIRAHRYFLFESLFRKPHCWPTGATRQRQY